MLPREGAWPYGVADSLYLPLPGETANGYLIAAHIVGAKSREHDEGQGAAEDSRKRAGELVS